MRRNPDDRLVLPPDDGCAAPARFDLDFADFALAEDIVTAQLPCLRVVFWV